MITQEYLRYWFNYEDGKLVFKRKKPYYKVGQALEGRNSTGYLMARLEGKRIYVHRLIWLYHYNYLPDLIDHIDNNKLNNRIENLRLASKSENAQNSLKRTDKKKSGLPKGIWLQKNGAVYRARVKKDGVYCEKSSKDLNIIIDWVAKAREQLHGEFANHG